MLPEDTAKSYLTSWLARLRAIAPERYLLLVCLAVAIAAWACAASMLPRPLEVTAFDVGKGDAFLIRSPSGRTVLIDGGSSSVPGVGAHVLAPNLLLHHVRRLDAIILTHPDSDHVNGLADVVAALPVGMILDPELPSEGTEYRRLMELARDKAIPCYRVRAGARINLSAHTTLQVLAPVDPLLSGTTSDSNNNSVVCLLQYGQARMLFTGDLEHAGEEALLARAPDLHADVLKVAHHGSRNGSCAAFLDAVRPSLAVISCPGGEMSEHPHRETLARLRERQISIARTDVGGELRLTTWGNGWRITPFRRNH
ncbi:MAG TPA: ComEC/Rec2 family competence protein [Armatimonadota bacterium]|jgi:beta-lactamase superfamily II metal-dependent hydrolase